MTTTDAQPKGISERNRHHLTALHRGARGPFTVTDAVGLLSLDIPRTQRLLAHLAERGWLARIQRGLYTTVPLDAVDPARWREDPWIVASKVFSPDFYVGGWTAGQHWEFTTQIFRETVVFTSRRIRHRSTEIQGFPYRVKSVSVNKMFGTQGVWRAQSRVTLSNPTRTIVDILDDPFIGGGIRHVAEMLEAYMDGDQRDDSLLIEHAVRLGNRSVFKRLGYLLESLGLPNKRLIRASRIRMSSGYSLLDPTLPPSGRILRRWNLRLNARLTAEGASN